MERLTPPPYNPRLRSIYLSSLASLQRAKAFSPPRPSPTITTTTQTITHTPPLPPPTVAPSAIGSPSCHHLLILLLVVCTSLAAAGLYYYLHAHRSRSRSSHSSSRSGGGTPAAHSSPRKRRRVALPLSLDGARSSRAPSSSGTRSALSSPTTTARNSVDDGTSTPPLSAGLRTRSTHQRSSVSSLVDPEFLRAMEAVERGEAEKKGWLEGRYERVVERVAGALERMVKDDDGDEGRERLVGA